MNEFDIIVIGGGSGGSAAAGRLSQNGKYSVCLIEAGGKNDNFLVKTPGMLPFLPDKSNYKYETVPQKGLLGRVGYQPRGRGLGGSSAINAMIYIRGNAWDYDNWASLGCDGWSHDDVLPYFIRSEGNERFFHDNDIHGTNGPLSVMDQHYYNPFSAKFVEAAANLQMPLTDDFNGQKQEGFGIYQVTQKGGERWSAARAYVEPAVNAHNLHVITDAQSEKIIIENSRAVGVKIRRGRNIEIIKARGAVILSAGAFNSPQILMLSGIGDGAHLSEMGIETKVDKLAVGNHLQDHIDYVSSFETTSKIPIGDSLSGTWRMVKSIIEHRFKRTGVMTTPYAESGGFWSSDKNLPAPDIQYHFVPAMLEDHGRTKVKGHGFSCHACVLRPYSEGTVRLKSNDIADGPIIDPNFLDDPRDLATLRAGVRKMHDIISAPPLSDYAPTNRHPCNIDDDAELDAMIRSRADTVYHPVGTCHMGNDESSVVDTQLRVRGVAGLYVADASIMPKLVSGNTNAPSIMIGERAADFVAAHLG